MPTVEPHTQIGWRVWVDDPEEEIGSIFVKDGELTFRASCNYFIDKDEVLSWLVNWISRNVESKKEQYTLRWWEEVRDAINGNIGISHINDSLKEKERPIFLRGIITKVKMIEKAF